MNEKTMAQAIIDNIQHEHLSELSDYLADPLDCECLAIAADKLRLAAEKLEDLAHVVAGTTLDNLYASTCERQAIQNQPR
jgi:hypothetical protein